LISPVSACGRCGAPNSEDAEFCQSCGALLAAYRAPTGATEIPELIVPPIDVPTSQSTTYQPPISQSLPTPVEPIVRSNYGNTATVRLHGEPSPLAAEVEGVENSSSVASPAAPSTSQQHVSAWREAAAQPQTVPLPHPTESTTHAPTPPRQSSSPTPSEPLPVSDAHRALYERNLPKPPMVPSSNRRSNSGRRNSTPHLLIFAGVSAFMLAFFIGVSAGSTMSVVLLFIGGPLGFGLIMAGVLLLIGRHPTGRP
jgi:zinc-ribbon domain